MSSTTYNKQDKLKTTGAVVVQEGVQEVCFGPWARCYRVRGRVHQRQSVTGLTQRQTITHIHTYSQFRTIK